MTATSDYLNRPVRSEREAQLEAENKRLREAMAPFAREAETWWNEVPDSARPGVCEPMSRSWVSDAEYTIGDLRRARDVLAALSPTSNGGA